MKHFLAPLIVALGAALSTASLVHAEILIGMSGPMTGSMAWFGEHGGDYLAERWGDRDIAIVHDGQAYGKGIAEEVLRRLSDRGVTGILFEAIEPGHADYSKLIDKLQAEGIDALYFGGYTAEAGLIIRQARSRGYDLQMIGSDALITECFWHVAGPAAVGVRFVSYADPRISEEAAAIVEQFRADGYEPEGLTLYSYAGVQVWAQAVASAGTVETKAVAAALRTHQFDTVLGTIGFDEKGDVYGYEPFAWYVWKDGDYAPPRPMPPGSIRSRSGSRSSPAARSRAPASARSPSCALRSTPSSKPTTLPLRRSNGATPQAIPRASPYGSRIYDCVH
jgi:ABC-type branched-subunit amino acid transport system substrate-binding protein